MANKESAERKELHRKIWAIADDVRGAVDGWDFKQYILGILFYRFISEHMADYFDHAEHEAGDLEFRYADLSDQEAERDFKPGTVEDKGFFILPSQLFENVVKNASQNENLNEDLANIFQDIEKSAIGFKSEDDIKGLFDNLDTRSNILGGTVPEKNKRLYDILNGINSINFGNFEENDIDAFGDAYEFLISNYASNAGKSGGEFFAPVDNQRYLLVAQKAPAGQSKYFVVPSLFEKRKEDAHLFQNAVAPHIGNYQLVYTRNEAGRKILLEARLKSLANKNDRIITKKKVKSALK